MERRSVFANNPAKKEELKKMYLEGKYNTEDLAKYFGTYRGTVRQVLIDMGVPIERRHNKKVYFIDVNVERIIEMYEDNISIAQIAKTMQVDRTVIESRLVDNGYDLSGIRQEKKFNGIDSCYHRLYKKYKVNARQRGYSFDLDEQDFFKLLQGNCVYCGDEPKQITKCNTHEALYNGVDRIDNAKGYSKDNCVPCCWICNRFKLDLTHDELMGHVKKMYNNLYKE